MLCLFSFLLAELPVEEDGGIVPFRSGIKSVARGVLGSAREIQVRVSRSAFSGGE